RRHDSQFLQFSQSTRVRSNVSVCEGDVVLPKELLGPIAEHSTRLRVEDDGMRHRSEAHRLESTFEQGNRRNSAWIEPSSGWLLWSRRLRHPEQIAVLIQHRWCRVGATRISRGERSHVEYLIVGRDMKRHKSSVQI